MEENLVLLNWMDKCTSNERYPVYTMQGKVNHKWPAYEEY